MWLLRSSSLATSSGKGPVHESRNFRMVSSSSSLTARTGTPARWLHAISSGKELLQGAHHVAQKKSMWRPRSRSATATPETPAAPGLLPAPEVPDAVDTTAVPAAPAATDPPAAPAAVGV